jgi:AcrR family transcriptional regulator
MRLREPSRERSRTRSAQRARVIVDAARRLFVQKGDAFTTQDLVKEGGIALQTFYNSFASKDELVLAVIEDIVGEYYALYAAGARELSDPIARLRFYITSSFETLDDAGADAATARFLVAAQWRLQRIFPDETSIAAIKPFADLLVPEIEAGVKAGLLDSPNAVEDAWFITHLVGSVYHRSVFATTRSPSVAEDLWQFCLRALGGAPN